MINHRKLFTGALSLALFSAVAQPAFAQGAAAQGAAVTVGATVKDSAGGEVGTITAVNGTTVTLKTDKHEVQLPTTSFAAHNGAFLISLTRDQLNSEAEKALAAAQASLQPGVTVTGSGGATVGVIEALDPQFATLKLTSGKLVRIPRAGIAPSANGAVLGLTAAELSAAAEASEATAASTPS